MKVVHTISKGKNLSVTTTTEIPFHGSICGIQADHYEMGRDDLMMMIRMLVGDPKMLQNRLEFLLARFSAETEDPVNANQ